MATWINSIGEEMSYYDYKPYASPFKWDAGERIMNKCSKLEDTTNPKDYPYQIGYKNFKSLTEAEGFAKRLAAEEHEDVVIKQRVSVVRFPLPDLKVESLVQA